MALDRTEIYNKYKGLWVALADDEITVVGSGETAKEALQMAQKAGCDDPILSHFPDKLMPYVGFINEI